MENKFLFSFLLQESKEKAGIFYKEFAAAVGIHVSTVSKLLSGEVKPTPAQRERIADYFGFDNVDSIIFARDNDLTVREVIKQKDEEIKYWQDKFLEVLDKLESTNEQVCEYRKLVRNLMCQMTHQLDFTETYDLSIYKDLREEVKTK